MQISFFIGGMGRGGAERVISILANDYCSKGWDVDIVLLLKNKVEYPLDSRIKIVNICPKSGGYVKNAVYWLINIRRYLKKTRPDRTVSFVGRINALILTAAVGLNLHIVVSERNDPKHDNRGALMLWYCNKIYHQAKKIVYQNEYEKSCFSPSLSAIGVVIPNPVNVSAYKTNHESDTIVSAGRLVKQKNHTMLIRAMKTIHEKYPEVKCKIYGEGVLRDELQEQIDKSGLHDTVTLEGSVKDIHERIAQCGIFVMTSNYEGLSNALIEAMMVGMPCITTDYPGVRELITHGKTGLIVPIDNEGALVQEIIKLIDNNANCANTIAQNGQAYVTRFQADTVLEQWHKVVEG